MARSPLWLSFLALSLVACAKDRKQEPAPALAPSSPAAAIATRQDMVPSYPSVPKKKDSEEKPEKKKELPKNPESENPLPLPEVPPQADPAEPAPEAPAEPEAAEEPIPPPAPAPQPENQPQEDDVAKVIAQDRARNVNLSCKNGQCHPSVGLLSMVSLGEDGWAAEQCTASLIGPDLLVTNSHCIPEDLSEPGSACDGRMWISFGADPEHPNYDHQIGCAKVLFQNKTLGFNGSDYAYIQLQHASNRPTLRPSRAGFAASRDYSLHKVNPKRMPGGVAGEMEKVTCRTMYDSAIFPAPLNAKSPTMLFTDCSVIPGNSGAPIFAEDGSVRGVIYAFLKKPEMFGILHKNGSRVPSPEEMAALNVGSNFACLNGPGDTSGASVPRACPGPSSFAAAKQENDAKILAPLHDRAQKILATKQKGKMEIAAFRWGLQISDSDESGNLAFGVPACVRVSEAHDLLGVTRDIHRPVFFLKVNYDKYLRALDRALVWAGFADAKEELNVRQAGSVYRLEISDPMAVQAAFSGTLEACKK